MAGGEDVFSLSGEEDLSEQEDDGYYFDSDNGNSDDDSLGYGEAESEDDEESLSRKVRAAYMLTVLLLGALTRLAWPGPVCGAYARAGQGETTSCYARCGVRALSLPGRRSGIASPLQLERRTTSGRLVSG